jgi:hypothetical protein
VTKGAILTAAAVVSLALAVLIVLSIKPVELTLEGFEFRKQGNNDWLITLWNVRNPSGSFAEDLVIMTEHFDGVGWLSPIRSDTSSVRPHRSRQYTTTMATRAAPKCYLGMLDGCKAMEPPMMISATVRWTSFVGWRRSIKRGFALRAEDFRAGGI